MLRCLLLIILVSANLAALQPASALSIEPSEPPKPVKVTHKNSGPSYMIDLNDNSNENNDARLRATSSQDDDSVEKQRIPSNEQAAGPAESGDAEQMPVQHVSLRRIFLVPMMPARSEAEGEREPFAMRNPFWRPTFGSHMTPGESGEGPLLRSVLAGDERKDGLRPQRPEAAGLDPLRIMIELMNQAINERLNSAGGEPQDKGGDGQRQPAAGNDLSKEATNSADQQSAANGMIKPQSHNETKEEIVEIEGKKYLKKSVFNKHVGENIIFVTRRLIFVPLNETESTSTTAEPAAKAPPAAEPTTTTTTTTAEPMTASTTFNEVNSDAAAKPSSSPAFGAQPADSTETTASEQPITATSRVDLPEKEDVTTRAFREPIDVVVSTMDRVSEVPIDKASGRQVEKANEELKSSSTTSKP